MDDVILYWLKNSRIIQSCLVLFILTGCKNESPELESEKVFASMRIDGELIEFHQESFISLTEVSGTVDSTFVRYDGSFFDENSDQICVFSFHFKYDTSLINGSTRDSQFNDIRDFYNSFEIESVDYYDIDNQKYPAFTFGYHDSSKRVSTHRDIKYQYEVDQRNSHIYFEQVRGMYRPDGLFIKGTFECNLYEEESGSVSVLTDGNFQIFIQAP